MARPKYSRRARPQLRRPQRCLQSLPEAFLHSGDSHCGAPHFLSAVGLHRGDRRRGRDGPRLAAGDTGARVSQSVSDRDLRRVGGDIDEIAERLARSIDYQRRFITHAAHELRSPLAALYGELQQTLRRERTADEYKQSLASALKASRRLKRLADDLLALARAERNKKPESIPVNVASPTQSKRYHHSRTRKTWSLNMTRLNAA